jgi:hypothetical protein
VVADVRINAGVSSLPQPHYTDGSEREHDGGAQRPSDLSSKLHVVQRPRIKLVRGISLLEILPHEPKYAAADAEVSEELRDAVTVGGGVTVVWATVGGACT